MRVLIVEDHVKMAGLIRRGLRKEGMAVDVAADGEDALTRAGATEYDAIVLDVMLPGIDGFEVCRRLRADDVWTPILMLTARDAVRDRVAGLDMGADDYLTKPFSYAELLARLRALVRRGAVERPPELRVGDLRLDPARRQAWRGDGPISLSAKEFSILEVFMRRPGEVLSRFQLLEHAWDYDYENRSNVVDSYIRLLRRKIDRPFGSRASRPCGGRATGSARRPDALSRLPTRLRVTLVFAGIMAVVLAATGLFLRLRLEHNLDQSINQDLQSRSDGLVSADPHRRAPPRRAGPKRPEGARRELRAGPDAGRERSSAPRPARGPAAARPGRGPAHRTDADLRRALGRSRLGNEPVRLLATPTPFERHRLIVIVGRPSPLATMP